MDDYTVPLDAETEKYCSLYLFKNVQNSSEICRKIMNGELACSALKASLMADPFPVIISANKAAINAKMNQLITKNVHSEILFNFAMSKNISRALTVFGIGDSDKNILIASVHEIDEEEPMSHVLMDTVKGERISVSKLSEYRDIELIKKAYNIEKDELKVSSLIDSIVSRISSKDFILVK